MTIYDFDGGAANDYIEQFTLEKFAYYKTPLRPVSGNTITSVVAVNEPLKTFTSTAAGNSSNNPSDTSSLTDDQAARGVQVFIAAEDGSLDARFAVASATPGCGGRNLLFAGDSQL